MAGDVFVSRGGLKLRHALDAFGLPPIGLGVRGWTCADFGCSTGGFTDCLLHAGASRVYAIDTAYGELAWKLRNDPRVVVMERTNCLHAPVPEGVAQAGGVDLVTIDASWTPQRLAIPAALRWARAEGRIITLIKPHYEVKGFGAALGIALTRGGVLAEEQAEAIRDAALARMESLGARVLGLVKSPVLGGAAGAGKAGTGNVEYAALLERIT
jgi:23S rRNA (cytidine1920-2'-O)/16S rRNA (cytidine1409-2'-O)-methyltransferase